MANDQKAGARRREFLRSHGFALATGAVAVAGLAVALAFFLTDKSPTVVRKPPELTIVTIVEPPPPPQEIEQPEMVEQPEITEPEIEQEQPEPQDEPPPDQANDEPPPDLATEEPPTGPLGLDTVAEGPGDAFNLVGRPGGNGLLGSAGGGGSRWGWYAFIVQRQLEQALREHRRTRTAKTRIEIRLWVDDGGRITRVVLHPSTGNPEIDHAIENEVLMGLRLERPPPSDMPMPIVARLTATHPGRS